MGLNCSTPNNLDRKKVLVLGYYYHDNFGDDCFITVLQKYWSLYVDLIFEDIENPSREHVENADLIVLGGGDLLQSYFMAKIMLYVYPYKNCPLYAIGVSIPYSEEIDNGLFDTIDKFWCRFDKDVNLLRQRYGNDSVFRIHELVLGIDTVPKPRSKKKYNVGLCFSHSMVLGNPELMMRQIETLVENLTDRDYHCYWMAFNDDRIVEKESDVALFHDLSQSCKRKLVFVRGEDILRELPKMNLIIASRFHAHVLAYLYQIPVISLVMTNKVKNWAAEYLHDSNAITLQTSCKDSKCNDCVNFKGKPVNFPVKEILQKISRCSVPSYNLLRIREDLQKELTFIITSKWGYRLKPPYYLDSETISEHIHRLQNFIEIVESKVSNEFIASCISLELVGDSKSKYYHTLVQNLSQPTFSLAEEVDRILRDYYSHTFQWQRKLKSNPYGKINMTYIHQNTMDGFHRSGWSYAMKVLSVEHNSEGIIFDGYLDRTFGWDAEYFKELQYIPYRNEWVGFIHHPPKAVDSDNDATRLLSNKYFQQSLPYCLGIFVMTENLKQWLQDQDVIKTNRIPVEVIYHPTEVVPSRFSWNAFRDNPDPKIVQIGVWLRDPYGIFKLKTDSIGKALLKTCETDYYLLNIEKCLAPDEKPTIASMISDVLTEQYRSVELIETLSNDQYDDLLAKNIVFLPLKEAVANNTIIECIVRETPLLVPPLPGVKEYLGDDYPCYYSNLREADEILKDFERIRNAHRYLKHMDKSFITPQRFLHDFRMGLRKMLQSKNC